MDITIDKKKYIFKEVLNYEEDDKVNLIQYMIPLISEDKEALKDKKLLEMVMSHDFNEKGVILISLLSLEPKLSIEEVKELPKPTVLQLMLQCIKTYTKSYTKVFSNLNLDDTKKNLGLETLIKQ